MKKLFRTLFASVGLSAVLGGSPALSQDTEAAQPSFASAIADQENWREVAPENLIIFTINTADDAFRGKVYIETADFAAPKHTKRFKEVVRSGDYVGTVFHRVIDDFMAQGGDVKRVKPESTWENIEQEFVFKRKPYDATDEMPKAQLLGEPAAATAGYISGFPIGTQSEFLASLTKEGSIESWIVHCPGVVSTARTSDPNSASTQFFLMRETSPHLDKTYTAWGRVVVGVDIVKKIKRGAADDGGTVQRPDVLVAAAIASDLDEADRPRILVQRTDGPEFAKFLAANPGANPCDLPPVPTILAQ